MVRGKYWGGKRDVVFKEFVDNFPIDNSFLLFLKELAQITKANYPRAYPDLHGKNFMRRGSTSGELVVTDPFTWE